MGSPVSSEIRFTQRLSAPALFDLALVVRSHGWFDLAPNRWDPDRGVLSTVLTAQNAAWDADVRADGGGIVARLHGRGPCAAARTLARRALARMLDLRADLTAFWSLCEERTTLRWAARRGAGRLLRAPTLFEDLLKILLTTNCSWAATRAMVARLVGGLGAPAPSGRRAFPAPEAVLTAGERYLRASVRAGYRASAAVELARRFVSGEIDALALENPRIATDDLRVRLLALPGFGPYAAGQALRLLGRCEDLALDSWSRGKIAWLLGRKRPPTDRAIERRLAPFGAWRGLALWLELTADWIGEGSRGPRPTLLGAPRPGLRGATGVDGEGRPPDDGGKARGAERFRDPFVRPPQE